MGPPTFAADVFLVLKMLFCQSAPSPIYFKLNLTNFEIDIDAKICWDTQPRKRLRVLHFLQEKLRVLLSIQQIVGKALWLHRSSMCLWTIYLLIWVAILSKLVGTSFHLQIAKLILGRFILCCTSFFVQKDSHSSFLLLFCHSYIFASYQKRCIYWQVNFSPHWKLNLEFHTTLYHLVSY